MQDNTIIYNSCDKAAHISHLLDTKHFKSIIFSADSTIMEILFLTTYVKDTGSDSCVEIGLEAPPPQPQTLLKRLCILQQSLHPTGGEEMYCDIQKVRTYFFKKKVELQNVQIWLLANIFYVDAFTEV